MAMAWWQGIAGCAELAEIDLRRQQRVGAG